MPRGIFQKQNGLKGTIELGEIGAVIGQFERWTLTRRYKSDDQPDDEGLWNLNGVLRFINSALFADPDYEKEVYIIYEWIEGKERKTRRFRLERVGDHKVALDGRSLLMEGVRMCPA